MGQFQVGHAKLAGRKKGTVNKRTEHAEECLATMARLGVNPIEAMCLIVLDEVPCSTCRGAGITKYQPATAYTVCTACYMRMKALGAPDSGCPICHGTGKEKVLSGKLLERTCESCYGSGKEKIAPELKGKMAAELAQYGYPKRRAIEVTMDVGGTIAEAMQRAAARVKELK